MAKTVFAGPYSGLVSKLAGIANERGAVNLSNDYTDFPIHPELLQCIVKHLSEGRNKYAPSEGVYELREVIAQRYQKEFGYDFSPETDITITAGATQAIYTAISSIISEGDEVIVFEPAFETYVPAILARGARPIFFQLNPADFTIDWNALTKLISTKTKLIILNCPHNPTGVVFSDESLEQFQRMLNGTKISILSDESFGELIFDGSGMFSLARFPKLADRSIIVGSLGKTLSVPGWKIGYCLAPAPLMARFRDVHTYQIYSVNLPIQLALADFLKGRQRWSPYRAEFQSRVELFGKLMAGSRFTLFPVQGGYFQVIGYEQISNERDVDYCQHLAQEQGVSAFPLSLFYHDSFDAQRLRVCFGKSEADLRLAAERLRGL